MPSKCLSFGEQALRYFQRPHETVRREPLELRAAWRGGDLAGHSDWSVTLSPAQIEELEGAAEVVEARSLDLENAGREDFPLPTLAAAIDAWADELALGRGFLLVRGLPVERWGERRASIVFWGLGQHLGEPGAQNPRGDLLGEVADTGEDAADPFVRRYRTAGDIAYHCDLADVVGLLCLKTARRGGASRIVSSVSVYNELLRRRPDLIDRLYEPFQLDTRNEEVEPPSGGDAHRSSDAARPSARGQAERRERGPRCVPVPPCRHAGGVLRTFYHSDYFRSAVRHSEVPPFSDAERTLLDLYEEIASTPGLYLDMQFAPGDIQLLSNHVVLHARTAYEDPPDPEHKRRLLRLWLSLRRP